MRISRRDLLAAASLTTAAVAVAATAPAHAQTTPPLPAQRVEGGHNVARLMPWQ